ncbi:uncharacterized protein LOC144427223 [Styela clava]
MELFFINLNASQIPRVVCVCCAISLVQQHCVAHRLALAVKDAYAEDDAMQQLDHLMNLIYSYFCKALVRRSGLEQCIAFAITQEKGVRMTAIAKTRWQSRGAAVKATCATYKSLHTYLEERNVQRQEPAASLISSYLANQE